MNEPFAISLGKETGTSGHSIIYSPDRAQLMHRRLISDEDLLLDLHCPPECPMMTEMFYICAIQCSSCKPRLATEHLKCG